MTRRFTLAAALTVVAAGMLVDPSVAAAKPGPVVATYKVASGSYVLAAGSDAMWALQADETHDGLLYRIDPVSHGMKLLTTLPFPAGSLTAAFGSLWVSDYFGNAVWRVGVNGHVQAEIGVGLQPQWMHAAFGSVWVSNHHGGSVSRIDPTTNTAVATVPVGAPDTFRNGPQDLTDDGTDVYVGSSNLQSLQAIDPSTETVTTPASVDDAFCGPMTTAGGYVWSQDACTGATYQLGTDGTVRQAIPSAGSPGGITTRGAELWMSEDRTFDPDTFRGSDAALEQLDPVTGAVLRVVAIGGDASDVEAGFGDLWVYDVNASTIRRVHV